MVLYNNICAINPVHVLQPSKCKNSILTNFYFNRLYFHANSKFKIFNMTKYFVVLFLLFVFINLKSFSQSRDSLIKVYNNQTIYRFGNKYMKGSERLTYGDLRLEFNTPSTQEMYKKSKRRLSVSRIFNVASLGVIIASVLTKTNVKGSIEFAAGTGILGLGGIYYQTESSKYLERAIWERNREILFNTFH